MKIFSCRRDRTACNFYRIETPLYALQDKELAEVAICEEHQLGSEKAIEAALWADILVFHRPADENWFKFIKLMQKYGKVFVSDYDDNPFHTSPMSPAYAHFGTQELEYEWPDGKKEWLWRNGMLSKDGSKVLFDIERNIRHLEMFRANFRKSDIISCTTPELRETFLEVNPNTVVLPNLITPDWFPENPGMYKDKVRICWQGGSSHYEDLFFIVPVIKNVLKKHDNVKFVFYGDGRFMPLFNDCDQSKIEFHHWTSHDVYPYKLTLMNIDIGLCPLVDNEFNRMKSAIKWMEYSMVGAATIAANIPPYSKVISHGNTGILCKEDEKEWEDQLDYLIKSTSSRYAMACEAKNEVLKNHNVETKAHLWLEAYEAVLKPKVAVI